MLTYAIIALTCLISITCFQNQDLYSKLLFNSYTIHRNKQWYRFITHGLVHADWMHLIFNMMSLFFFGRFVESAYIFYFGEIQGEIIFLTQYVLSIVMSSAFDFEKHKHNAYYSAVGASGGVFAIMFSQIILMPAKTISIMLLPPMPGFIVGPLLLALSLYLAKRNADNIGHAAHFSGAIFGILFPICVKPELFLAFIVQIQHYFMR